MTWSSPKVPRVQGTPSVVCPEYPARFRTSDSSDSMLTDLQVHHAFQLYGQGRSNRYVNPDSMQRRPDEVTDRSLRPNQPISFMEQRTSKHSLWCAMGMLTSSRLPPNIATNPQPCTSKQYIRSSTLTKKSVSALLKSFRIVFFCKGHFVRVYPRTASERT
jgi:hypothetical protein